MKKWNCIIPVQSAVGGKSKPSYITVQYSPISILLLFFMFLDYGIVNIACLVLCHRIPGTWFYCLVSQKITENKFIVWICRLRISVSLLRFWGLCLIYLCIVIRGYTVIVLLSIDDKFNGNFKIIWSDISFFFYFHSGQALHYLHFAIKVRWPCSE